MTDIELIRFEIPSSNATQIYIPSFSVPSSFSELTLFTSLETHFSQFGLLNQLTLTKLDEETSDVVQYYSYIRFYSVKAASTARRLSRGEVRLKNLKEVVFKVLPAPAKVEVKKAPLPRWKCEEMANHYLGFNGWSSEMLYHRREETDSNKIKYVSVVKLHFRGSGLTCEGAGQVEEDCPDNFEGKMKTIESVSKRARAEALMNAWSKVILVVVYGPFKWKVWVEIDTTRKDPFYYDPLWDHPVLEVAEADYREEEETTNMADESWECEAFDICESST